MTGLPKRFSYKRAGAMSYAVVRLSDGVLIGNLWRTREGWRYRAPGGAAEEVYGVSRDVAAGLLSVAHKVGSLS